MAGTSTSYDAVVVGGGVGGSVMARRLSDGGKRVLLVEAGPGEPRPPTVRGLDTIAASQEHRRLWPDVMATDDPLGDHETQGRPYRQGFGLGGGSMVNSLVLSPGDRAGYDRWRATHRCDWDADDMAPWLEVAATAFPGEPLAPGPVSAAFAAAAVEAGHNTGGTSMDQDRAGVVSAQLAKSGDLRNTTVDSYGLPGESRGELLGEVDGRSTGPAVLTDTAVTTILVDDDRRAAGVVLANGKRVAAPLIVLSCGAIQTPLLLLRSGLDDRPVGAGLKDHPSFAFTLQLSDGANSAGQRTRAVSTVLRWSADGTDDLDLQAIVIDRVDEGGEPPLAAVVVGLMRVNSAGAVTAGDSGRSALINTGALRDAEDRRRLRTGVLAMLELLTGEAMAPVVANVFIDDRGTPAASLAAMTPDEYDRWIAEHPGPYAHPACTCPMGDPDDERSVVSGRAGELGRLLGYQGVYLADASIMADLVNGGLQLPVVAIAERIAAQLLTQRI